MRLLLAGTAAAVFAFAATPAFAQYGGNPQDQVEGAPAEAQAAPEAVVPDEVTFSDPADDQTAMAPDEGAAEDIAAGKPGMDETGAADEAPADVDADADVDSDVDQGNVDTDVEADAQANAGQGNADLDTDVDADVDADADQDADADSEDMAPGEVDADEGYEDQEGEPGDGGVAGGGRS